MYESPDTTHLDIRFLVTVREQIQQSWGPSLIAITVQNGHEQNIWVSLDLVFASSTLILVNIAMRIYFLHDAEDTLQGDKREIFD